MPCAVLSLHIHNIQIKTLYDALATDNYILKYTETYAVYTDIALHALICIAQIIYNYMMLHGIGNGEKATGTKGEFPLKPTSYDTILVYFIINCKAKCIISSKRTK